jgi:hypothetical protein
MTQIQGWRDTEARKDRWVQFLIFKALPSEDWYAFREYDDDVMGKIDAWRPEHHAYRAICRLLVKNAGAPRSWKLI